MVRFCTWASVCALMLDGSVRFGLCRIEGKFRKEEIFGATGVFG
jgi:hypothetical protein